MARARTATARSAVPRAPRRVSGPARPRAVPGRPRPTTPVAAPSTLGARLGALPDHRLLDRLLRSRAWIWLLGIALGGIVAMQVSLLGMNTGISRAVQQSTELQRANSALEAETARLSSGDIVRAKAKEVGLVSPDAGSVSFLKTRPKQDAGRGADRISPPSETAQANLANGGRAATTPVDPATATTDPATATTTDPAVATTATTETVPPDVAVTPAPVASAAPVEPVVP